MYTFSVHLDQIENLYVNKTHLDIDADLQFLVQNQFENISETVAQSNNVHKSFTEDQNNYKKKADYRLVYCQNSLAIYDFENRKFEINFKEDQLNYLKKKGSLKSEPLARALGSGEKGFKLLDLSAGLGIDSVFLSQLGFEVTALERNALIFLALQRAQKKSEFPVQFNFSEALTYLKKINSESFDVAYFDPMFPAKKKSALPKQEMVVFKNLVGSDDDATHVVEYIQAQKLFKRFVVKRPLSAPAFLKPAGCITGKLIRFDIYNFKI